MMAWNVVNPILYSLDYWVLYRTNKKNGNFYRETYRDSNIIPTERPRMYSPLLFPPSPSSRDIGF
jgi:hypothetical protein